MKNICVKLSQRENKKYRKMLSSEEAIFPAFDPENTSTSPYTPGATLQDDDWFCISNARGKEYSIDLLSETFTTVDLESLTRGEFDKIDYLIMDCKHWDEDAHRRVIGCGNRQTLDNIRKASQARTQLLVRIPLIGGFNSSPADAEGFAEALSFLGGEQCVEVLRYHEYGKDKWKQCGMAYTMQDAFVSDDAFRTFCKILADSGLHLIKT